MPSRIFSSIIFTILLFSLSNVNASGQPPAGYRPAISSYVGPGMGNPQRVWVKVINKPTEKVINVWVPPSRQGAIANVYRGSCLKAGCIFILDNEGLKKEYRRKELKSISPQGFMLCDWSYNYE
jgi:hypothetical protein